MNDKALRYGPYELGQEKAISDMIWEVFCEFEAPGYSKEGIEIFREFINSERLANDIRNNGFKIYCCFEDDTLVGVLAVRNPAHISLLFVKKSHHRRGIAKELLNLAVTGVLWNNPDTEELTVNSSPYAVEIYKKMGFEVTDAMREKSGIIYMPMKKLLIQTEEGS